MAVGGLAIVCAQLFAVEVPMSVKPVRVTGGEEQLLRAVSLWEFLSCDWLGFELARSGIASTGAACSRWRGGVPLQQNGWHIDRFFRFGAPIVSFWRFCFLQIVCFHDRK